MRKMLLPMLSILSSVLFISCDKMKNSQQENPKQIDYTNVQEKSFSELFVEIQPDEIEGSPFSILSKNYTVVTSGFAESFNSMVIGEGMLGGSSRKLATSMRMRGNGYTLEKILETQTYTLTIFDERFKEQFMLFGQSSGRNSDKMKETTLTSVATPSGKFSYKEAYLIIECSLAETYTINLDEVYNDENHKFYEDAYNSVGSYHKVVVGDITNVWIRK